MRKLFTCFAAMLIALAVNAATTSVSSGVNTLKTAVAAASAGDVLELGDGIYYEEGNFDMKINLTIKAAEGAKPVIANRYYFRVEGGADITFKGLKFDGAGWRSGDADPLGASDYCARSYSASTGEEDVVFEDCEFTGYPSYILYTQRANRRWNSITIRNCYFYNNKRSAVHITNESGDNQSCNALTIENSTFANIAEAYDVIYYNAPDAEHTTTLNVDHCTFYNHPKRAIYWQKSENLSVSNCIFVQPAENTYKSVECVAGTVSNCLSYNSAGYSSATTRTDNIVEDPLFADAANGDYTLGAASPALAAGTDGSNLGDPRWWPAAPAGCDWDNIDFFNIGISDTDENYNQFKICKQGEQPNFVNIQTAPWANNNKGFYINFPDAVIGNLSLAADQYKIEGAGILLFLSAFTAKETEVTVEWQNGVYEFTVFNAKGVEVIKDITLDVTVPQAGDAVEPIINKGDALFDTFTSLVTLPAGANYEIDRFEFWQENGSFVEDNSTLAANTAYRMGIKIAPKEGYAFPMQASTQVKLEELNLTVNHNGTSHSLYNGWGYFGIIVNFATGEIPTGLNDIEDGVKAIKFIENGQLYIIKNDVKYNAQGAVVR